AAVEVVDRRIARKGNLQRRVGNLEIAVLRPAGCDAQRRDARTEIAQGGMIDQAFLDQIAATPPRQRLDVPEQRLPAQCPSARIAVIRPGKEPLLAAAATLAARRLDEQVASRQRAIALAFGYEPPCIALRIVLDLKQDTCR